MARGCNCGFLAVTVFAAAVIYSNALLNMEENESSWSRLKRAATSPTTPKPLDCASDSFPKTLTGCMKENPDKLFNKTVMMACNDNKKEDAIYDWVKSYLLNKYQVAKINNTIDWKAKKTIAELGPVACFVQCLFRKLENVIKADGSVDFSWIASNFAIDSTNPWFNNAELSFRVCSLSVPAYPEKAINVTVKKNVTTCSLAPLLAVQCAQNNMLSHIPSAIYKKDAACNKSEEVLVKCDLMPTMDFTGNK